MTECRTVSITITSKVKINFPVDGGDKHPVEVEDDAEIMVAPDPHGEGEAHHADDGEVGGAVQEDHHVNQGKLLHLVKFSDVRRLSNTGSSEPGAK